MAATINIFTNSSGGNASPGPQKVYMNLTKGLQKIGQPYTVNKPPSGNARIWIHDRLEALRLVFPRESRRTCGPNIVVHPKELPGDIEWGGATYVQPSEWARETWQAMGFAGCPLAVWPVGIDTDHYTPVSGKPRTPRVLIYHKRRSVNELGRIIAEIERRGWQYSLVLYGDYRDADYRDRLCWATMLIWHGCTESQGLALLEAHSSDVPAVICDCNTISHPMISRDTAGHQWKHRPTSAPYFDARCGIRIHDIDGLALAIDRMLDNYTHFRPREFILENLTLERQARRFLQLGSPISHD